MTDFTRYYVPRGGGVEDPSGRLYRREEVDPVVDALRTRIRELEAEKKALRTKLDAAHWATLNASLRAAELAESIGPSDEWSHDFKEGYVFGGRDAARTIRLKCTLPADAMAAREARDKQVWNEELREAASVPRRQGLKFTEDAILALIEGDQK